MRKTEEGLISSRIFLAVTDLRELKEKRVALEACGFIDFSPSWVIR